jgi:peptidoglycan/xylan/chitin deacetylase (PgdA/CDA1 family)
MPHPAKIIQKLNRGWNNLQRDVLWQLRFNRSRIYNATGGRILVYHGVCMNDPFRLNTLFVKLRNFEKQLQLYKKYFQVVSLDDFYQQNYDRNKFVVCFTFDDGFANNYKYVLPLLEQYQVPATFFITGIRNAGHDILWNDVLSIAGIYGQDKIVFKGDEYLKNKTRRYISTSGKKSLNDVLRSSGFEDKQQMMEEFGVLKNKINEDYWLQMTEGEIRKMSASKWATIGSHSYYHNDLAHVSGTSLNEDLVQSKNYLEELTGKEVKSIAFPYGSYSREAITAAKAAGYSQLLATEFLFPHDHEDSTMKERFTINPFISNINQMHANTRGNYK